MNENLIEELAQANSLLRSAYSIALREGKETNWEAFRNQLKNTLERQQELGILKGYWEFQLETVLSGFNSKSDPDEIERKLNDLLDPNR